MVLKKSMEIQTFFGKKFRIRQNTTRFDILHRLLYKKMQKRRNYQFLKSQAIQYKTVYFFTVGLSIILDTIIKKFDRRKPFEGTHRTIVCST